MQRVLFDVVGMCRQFQNLIMLLAIIKLLPSLELKAHSAPKAYHNHAKGNIVDIFGHRGHSFAFPENTLVAVESALKYADGAEIDVQITGDGQIVVLHDTTLKRTAIQNQTVEQKLLETDVSKLNWSDISHVRVGKPGSLQSVKGEKIPLLEDVLGLYLEERFQSKRLLIELKSAYSGEDLRFADKTLRALEKIFLNEEYEGLLSRIGFISFDEKLLNRLVRLPSFKARAKFYLVVEAWEIDSPETWPKMIEKIAAFDGIDLESNINLMRKNTLGKTFVEEVRFHNKKVLAWVNKKNRTDGILFYQIAEKLGIDVFTSDLDISLLNLDVTRERYQKIAHHLGISSNVSGPWVQSQNASHEGVIIYAPMAGMFDQSQDLIAAIKKDIYYLKELSSGEKVVVFLGDLTSTELAGFASVLRHEFKQQGNILLLTSELLPDTPMDTFAAYLKAWTSGNRRIINCKMDF